MTWIPSLCATIFSAGKTFIFRRTVQADHHRYTLHWLLTVNRAKAKKKSQMSTYGHLPWEDVLL